MPFAFAVLCLMLSASATMAETKTKNARGKSAERSRVVEAKKPTVKKNTAATVARETTRRSSAPRREVAAPLVRKTVIVSSPQDAQQRAANRQALVNDIVIISEAPVTSSLAPTTSMTGVSGNNMPSIWPVAGAMRGGYGVRRNPFGGSSSEFHKGQDISAPMGTPVIGTADGVVVIAGWQRGYGRVVYLDHGNGLSTRYGHLSRIDVVEGQTVKRGELLGLVGSTGRSTGPHLHYEVRMNGQAMNPLPYLPNVMVTSPGIQ